MLRIPCAFVFLIIVSLPCFADIEARAEKPSLPLKPVIHVADTETLVHESTLLTGKVTATVFLTVGELSLKDGVIHGTYAVDVDMSDIPLALRLLASKKKETGTISLPTKGSIEDMLIDGARLEGEGYCKAKNEKRKIICTIKPSEEQNLKGPIMLEIDSGTRILKFSSNYIVGESKRPKLASAE